MKKKDLQIAAVNWFIISFETFRNEYVSLDVLVNVLYKALGVDLKDSIEHVPNILEVNK